MKQLMLTHKNREYQVILCLDGYGVCDISIYRKRSSKKWYQGNWEDFVSFVYCPDTMEELNTAIYSMIEKKLVEEDTRNKFLTEYRKLEDVSLI